MILNKTKILSHLNDYLYALIRNSDNDVIESFTDMIADLNAGGFTT